MEEVYIKNMVCPRCIAAVETTLHHLGLPFKKVELGKVQLLEKVPADKKEELSKELITQGFAMMENPELILSERVKNLIIQKVRGNEGLLHFHENWSDYLAKQLRLDYQKISKTFSQQQGYSIEKYLIEQKIERAKELLDYNELSIKEIAFLLGYANVPHFSGQFKKVTQKSPSTYSRESTKDVLRKSIDF